MHLRGRNFLISDGLTIADFAVGITLPYAEAAKIPLAGFREIEGWHAATLPLRISDIRCMICSS